MDSNNKSLYIFILIITVSTGLAGLLYQGPIIAFQGFIDLQLHPSRLITDFTQTAGIGGALLNACLNGLIAVLIIFLSKVRLSGPTIAAVFTIMGFSLFGKTPLNILPIILGVYITSRIIHKSFSTYIIIALFGSALGPLAGFMAFEAGLSGAPALLAGALIGIGTGMILPALAVAMLRLHEGYNLYNMGLTCGFLGVFVASILSAMKYDMPITVIWNTQPSLLLILLAPAISLFMVIWGLATDGLRKSIKGLGEIFSLSGRLPSDFMSMVSPGAALVNAGILGLLTSAYIFALDGDFNGPTIGALFTIIGFATFGKHIKNTLPIVLGVVAATLLSGKGLTAPGPLLAFMFATTLAPIAGEFGFVTGFIAGFLHLVVVERTASWHGGLDLYNNGFAGGLVATFIIAIVEWYQANKHERVGKR